MDKLSEEELINIIEHDYHQTAFNKFDFIKEVLKNQDKAEKYDKTQIVWSEEEQKRMEIIEAMKKKLADEKYIKEHDYGYGEYDTYLIAVLEELLENKHG